ncbi:hypothetical protein [Rhodanobacter lindaniclasticus]
MPTNRRYLARARHAPIDPVHWAILTDAELPANVNPFLAADRTHDHVMRPLWEEHRAGILADWIAAHPGTRPYCWWRFDAPRATASTAGRYAGTATGAKMIEPRLLLSGFGKPLHEAMNYGPSYAYGIPKWYGDPDNPPTFETQHAYLKRHGLLERGERAPRSEPETLPERIEPAPHSSPAQ